MAKPKMPRMLSSNVKTLTKAGVIIEAGRLTAKETKIIESLTEDEVTALCNVFEKFSSLDEDLKHPFWRVFCF